MLKKINAMNSKWKSTLKDINMTDNLNVAVQFRQKNIHACAIETPSYVRAE